MAIHGLAREGWGCLRLDCFAALAMTRGGKTKGGMGSAGERMLKLDCFAALAMTRGGVSVLESLREFLGKGIKEAGKVIRKALSCS